MKMKDRLSFSRICRIIIVFYTLMQCIGVTGQVFKNNAGYKPSLTNKSSINNTESEPQTPAIPWYNSISIPPSPNASSLGKYGEFPIDKSTGVPTIEIPIYEINYGGMKVPITLSYHASGVKVQEEESWVGTGWSLNAGGVITRVMKGRPDDQECETKKGFLCLANNVLTKSYVDSRYYNSDCEIKDTLSNIAENELDYEPDIFFYNFLTFTGSFNFNNDGNISLRPDDKIRIEKYTNANGIYFKAIDTEGNIYTFDVIEKTKIEFKNSPITEHMEWISSWYLKTIENPKTNKKITFNYGYTPGYGKNQNINITEDSQYYFTNGSYTQISHNFPVYNFSELENEKFLYSIDFYNYNDVHGDTTLVYFFTGTRYSYHEELDSIWVFDNKKVKRFGFSYVLDQSPVINSTRDSYRQRLTALSEVGDNPGEVKEYRFTYDSQTLPAKDSYAIDHWGYYNGANTANIDVIIPTQVIGGRTFNGADRDPHWPYTKAGILTKIYFPTGGNTSFEYERNTYSSSSLIGGGVRIKSVKSYDPVSHDTLYKTYDYNNSGYLTLGYPQYYVNSTQYYCDGTLHDRPLLMLYSSPVAGLGASGNSVAYQKVTEYFGKSISNIGKTDTYFSFVSDEGSTNPFEFYPSLSYQWSRSKVLKDVTFRRIGSSFDTVQMKTYEYTSTPDKDTKGFKATMTTYSEGSSCIVPPCAPIEYNYKNFYITSTNRLLKKETTKQYFPDNKNVVSTTINYYDTTNVTNWDHFYPIETKQYNSNGDIVNTKFTYPDGSATGISGYMYRQNIIEPILNKSLYVNDQKTQEYKWNYDTLNNSNKLKLSSAEEWINSGSQPDFRTVMNYEEYDDYGNPIQVIGKDGIRTSYLWGHNHELLLAKVYNCKAKDFFYTSFEETDGNSNENDCATGKLSKTDGYSKSLTNLSNGSYLLAYYKKNLSGKWEYNIENKSVTNSSCQITLTGFIDEVRFYPATAQMTTYTYKPLVGMTSQTAPNGVTTYYEYDSFGRLKLIRDQKNKILKEFRYHYRGQQ